MNDESELRAFYASSYPEVYRYASRLAGASRADAEDLVHDAFVSLVHAQRRGDVGEVSVAWLITAVRNRFIDQVRRTNRHAWRRDTATDTGTSSEAMADSSSHSDAGTLTASLDRLTPQERAAVVLHHVDGYPIREVAAMLGTSTRAAESTLARGRARLRRIYTEGGRHV